MKYLLLLLSTILFSYSPLFAQDTPKAGIQFFEGTFDEVLQLAAKDNKLLFIDCYTTWCGPCKWMDAKVFVNDTVGGFYNQAFINYKLDMEKGEGKEIARRYSVKAYPTFLFINAEGEVVHRKVGSMPVNKFLDFGVIAMNPEISLMGYAKKYDAGDRSPKFIMVYAEALADAGDDDNAEIIVTDYINTVEESELTNFGNWLLISTYIKNIDNKAFIYVVENKDDFEKMYGEAVTEYIVDAANGYIRKASKDKDTALFEKILKIIEAHSTNAKADISMAKVIYYKATKEWNEYAVAAISYLDNNYYKRNLTQEEIDNISEETGRDYGQQLKGIYSSTLNNHAWTFYEQIDNVKQLEKALGWINESILLDNSYYNLDTKAALLLKMGNKKEGKIAVNEAIAKAKEEGMDYSGTEELLKTYKVK